MEALDQALERLSRGDLSSDIQASLAQDFAELKQNFNRTVNNLGETFTAWRRPQTTRPATHNTSPAPPPTWHAAPNSRQLPWRRLPPP